MNIAVVFPGQGSQSLGMLKEFASAYPKLLDYFHEASAVLGYDVWALMQNGPKEQLDQTFYTQPLMFCAGFATYQILKNELSLKPKIMAGHSLGELTALACAESLGFLDGVKLTLKRAQLMQEAVPSDHGAMAAIIGLSDEVVIHICERASKETKLHVIAANFNSPGQIVIAGNKEAVMFASNLAKESGARLTKILPVSVPSHCHLMKSAADQFENELSSIVIKKPVIPIVSNVSALPYQGIEDIKLGLVKQLYSPVQWVQSIRYMIKEGTQTFIESGPGQVLTSLIGRIDERVNALPLLKAQAVALTP